MLAHNTFPQKKKKNSVLKENWTTIGSYLFLLVFLTEHVKVLACKLETVMMKCRLVKTKAVNAF